MNIQNELLAMMALYHESDEDIEIKSLHENYREFYNKIIDNDLLIDSLSNIESYNYVNSCNGRFEMTNKGILEGRNKYVEYYFSEGVLRAKSSEAEKKYQIEKNFGIINSDSIIDSEQLNYISANLAGFRDKIFDLGCGKGDIISYIHNKHKSKCIGVDKSQSMIDIAKSKNNDITWINSDIEDYCKKMLNFNAAILVDSLYFVNNKKELIKNLFKKLNHNGRIVIAFSDYRYIKIDILQQTLNDLNINFTCKDFTKNEVRLWKHRKKITESLRQEYFKENNSFLYFDRISESTRLLKLLVNNEAKRYIYVLHNI